MKEETQKLLFDSKFHRWLIDAFDQRLLGDYEVDAEVIPEQVEEIIRQAREFLQAAQSYLSSHSSEENPRNHS